MSYEPVRLVIKFLEHSKVDLLAQKWKVRKKSWIDWGKNADQGFRKFWNSNNWIDYSWWTLIAENFHHIIYLIITIHWKHITTFPGNSVKFLGPQLSFVGWREIVGFWHCAHFLRPLCIIFMKRDFPWVGYTRTFKRKILWEQESNMDIRFKIGKEDFHLWDQARATIRRNKAFNKNPRSLDWVFQAWVKNKVIQKGSFMTISPLPLNVFSYPFTHICETGAKNCSGNWCSICFCIIIWFAHVSRIHFYWLQRLMYHTQSS